MKLTPQVACLPPSPRSQPSFLLCSLREAPLLWGPTPPQTKVLVGPFLTHDASMSHFFPLMSSLPTPIGPALSKASVISPLHPPVINHYDMLSKTSHVLSLIESNSGQGPSSPCWCQHRYFTPSLTTSPRRPRPCTPSTSQRPFLCSGPVGSPAAASLSPPFPGCAPRCSPTWPSSFTWAPAF